MEYWWTALCIVVGVLSIRYIFKNLNFFKKHDIIHVPPLLVIGATLRLIFRRISLGDLLEKLYYFQPDAKYLEFYAMMTPIILLRNPSLINEIFIKNFDAFPNRRGFSGFSDYLVAKNLFSLEGKRWREVRTLLTPAFTSIKMRTMFALMSECAAGFAAFMSILPADKHDVDMKDAFSKYTNDVIATCAFGIKVDSMRNPSNQFYVNGKDATEIRLIRTIKFIFVRSFPNLGRTFNLRYLSDHVSNFFKDIVKRTITTRDAESITRPDMIQLMMDMRGKRVVTEKFDIDDMTAQAFIFFLAGFDTSSTAMSFTAHEIAANPDIQAKLRQEIDAVLEESNGYVTYDAVNQLEYLDAVVNEALRLYPPIVFVERVCEAAFELPPTLPDEKPFVMKKSMLVWVPTYAIHRDERYYNEPKKFHPQRFLNDKTLHKAPYYLPFGVGPRMCIANRFALMEIKVVLFYLLATCELKPCSRTTLPMRLNKKSPLMGAEGGFWLNIERRSDIHPTIREKIRI